MLIRAPNLPRASQAQVDRAKIELERRLGPSKVTTSAEARAAYAKDDSDAEAPLPDAVVLATSAQDIAIALEIAERTGVPITPRAAGTGRTGGAVPAAGGIVLATHTLSKVKEIDRKNLIAVVEPGVITGAFQEECEREGLFYPPDPNSADTCMLGGNVAENAGGPRAFKYGVTKDYVLGIQACLMGGQILNTGRRTAKGVTGYDVTSLLVGSEGTLAVFSEITLSLVPKPPEVGTLLALFTDVEASGEAVSAIVAAGLVPRCLELLDSATLKAVRQQGVSIDPEAGAMLLIETDGTPASNEESLLRIGDLLTKIRGNREVLIAQDNAQRDRLWAARKSLSKATRKLAKYKLSEDIVVPRSEVAELLRRVDKIGQKTGARHLAYGHAGDGNLHVNFLWDDEDERQKVDAAIQSLMEETIALRGTLSGEHGIGLSKAAYMHLEQSQPLMDLQKNLKKVFDPKGLLNPGKIFPVQGHKAC